MIQLYDQTAFDISRITTKNYSTSFSLGIKTIDVSMRQHIYAIYAFARYADEIVDTFLDFPVTDRKRILDKYRSDTQDALIYGMSPNPILHSFQKVVKEFNIGPDLIEAFFNSMEMDLHKENHNEGSYDEYIYGSAEVIGLMCLRVFVKGNDEMYQTLKEPARRLGAAFQKVNFLRDMKSDFEDRGRIYFPNVNFNSFDWVTKREIEADIDSDFKSAYQGIMQLPEEARKGVYLAYKYYLALFNKIRRTDPETIQVKRLRIPNFIKVVILFKTLVRSAINTY